MRNRRRTLLTIALLAPLPALADAVDDFARTQMARSHIPAMAIVVVKDGTIQKMAAYGTADLDWEGAATPHTAFQMASGTKAFTGTLLMKMVRQGKLSLDDSVTRYLPDAPESWKKITIRHLASHTSGLKMSPGDKPFATIDDAVAAAYLLPFEYETGARSQYALTDFVVLTKILEKVSGRPFVTLLDEELVRPLGMEDTRLDDATEDGPVRSWRPIRGRAITYKWNGSEQRAYAFYYPRYTYSAGGLFSSAADVAKLLVALSRKTILDAPSLDAMWTPATLAGGGTGEFAVGWVSGRYRGLRAVGHSGGPALSDIVYFPDQDLGVAVLTNQGALFPILADLVADLYLPADARAVDPAVDDTEPKVTERLRAVVRGLAEGTVREEDFSEEGKKGIVPAMRQFGVAMAKELEPLRDFRLIGRKVDGAKRDYTYRANFGAHPMKWRFVLDADGRIADIDPSSRD
jgi:CubicO group peptidase (beta-lactamase class C family)